MPHPAETTTGMDFHLGGRLDTSKKHYTPDHADETAGQVDTETASTAPTSRSSSPSTVSTTSSVETLADGDVSGFEPFQLPEADVFDQDWQEWEAKETKKQPEQGTPLPKDAATETQPGAVGNSTVALENVTASIIHEAADSAALEKEAEKVEDGSIAQPHQTAVVSHEADPPVSPTTVKQGTQGSDNWRAAIRDLKFKWGRHVVELTPEMCEVAGLMETTDTAMNLNSTHNSAISNGGDAALITPTDDPELDVGLIWSNEYFAVKKSPLGGLGAFAVKDLKEGDIILVEKPLVRTDRIGLYNAVERLDRDDKLLYASLAQFPEGDDTGIELIRRIQNANAFEVPEGIAIFSIASRFNHACEPVRNVLYSHEKLDGENVIVLSVVVPTIPKGTELTIKYGSNAAVLMKNFGFRCRCGGCPEPLSDREAEAITKKWGWVPQNWDW